MTLPGSRKIRHARRRGVGDSQVLRGETGPQPDNANKPGSSMDHQRSTRVRWPEFIAVHLGQIAGEIICIKHTWPYNISDRHGATAVLLCVREGT